MDEIQHDQTAAGQELEFEDSFEEESPEIQVAADKRQIRTKSVDPEIVSLHDKWKRGVLTNAFKRFYGGDSANRNGAWEGKKFNASLYDVMMGVLCDKPKNQVYAALDSVREAFLDLMVSNREFIDAILLGTSAQDRVRKRFDLARAAIDDVLKHHKTQPRCFTLSLKKELFAANPACKICNQEIQHIDDSAVDHIHQYWQGGKTIPENARLTHRYCNAARPRDD